MKYVVSGLLSFILSTTSWSQVVIGVNGGIATSSKINYAANKSVQLVSGKLLYATNHFEGGICVTYYMLNDPAYTSILDVGIVANGRIPLSNRIDNTGSYITAGGGIGIGTADFGKGMSMGLQLAYGYQFSRHFALVTEVAPRFFNFTINQDMYSNKWVGFNNNTIDRFFVLPFTIGANIKF